MTIYNGVVNRGKWYAYSHSIMKRNEGAVASWQ